MCVFLLCVSLTMLCLCHGYHVLVHFEGTNFFRERAPEFFGNFKASLFTMFQVLSGDSSVARIIFGDDTEADVALFFVSYILIASIMLLNVVVAVLLDEFIATVTREKEEKAHQEFLEKERRKISGCLDPPTKSLTLFEDEEDLASRIASIYNKLDEDDSGGLNYHVGIGVVCY